MKIEDIKAYTIRSGRNLFIVKIETDKGIYGIGEGGLSGQEHEMAAFVERQARRLIGQDPFNTEHLWQVMSRGGFFPAQGSASAALSAIDIALWDIKGKALGVPVYQLLGGKCRDRAYVYRGCGPLGQPSCIEVAKKLIAEGVTTIRVAPESGKGDVFDPAERMEHAIAGWLELYEAVGKDVRMSMDVHTRLSPALALQFCQAIEHTRPFFIEDPIRSENPQSLKNLHARTSCPLAVGEQYSSKWAFRQVIEEEITDYARIDVCNVGGLTEAKKIAGWAEVHYIDIIPHNPLGPVSTAACVHLDVSINNFAVQESGSRMMEDVFPQQLIFKDGYWCIPDTPGLGVTFDEDAALKRGEVVWDTPMLRRSDGALTNW